MHDREAAKPDAAAQVAGARGGARNPQLPRAIGNRAMTRMVARMEATDAVDALKSSLAPGVLGAEHRVIDTMTAMSRDMTTFDQVAKDYEQQQKTPLPGDLGAAAGMIPRGWYPGINGS